MGLAEARSARDIAKRLLAQGQDPGEAKKTARRSASREAANTFSLIADELLAKMERDGRASNNVGKDTLAARVRQALHRRASDFSDHGA